MSFHWSFAFAKCEVNRMLLLLDVTLNGRWVATGLESDILTIIPKLKVLIKSTIFVLFENSKCFSTYIGLKILTQEIRKLSIEISWFS